MAAENHSTIEDLQKILKETEPEVRVLPPDLRKFADSLQDRTVTPELVKKYKHFVDDRKKTPRSQEIYPKIFIGEEGAARDINHIQNAGITHILNAGCGTGFGYVDTTEDMYKPHGIKFLAIQAADVNESKLKNHFQESFEFVDEALTSGSKFALCHRSYESSTIVAAYLMDRKGMSAVEAIRYICEKREILPNDGFLQQLLELEGELRISQPFGFIFFLFILATQLHAE